ncbi:MinD/ParA family protein [Clostridium sporogenes]|uniref:MinD/ParA family protein n=1 Tax=Clostridium botulinum TaxID=1491 RepID=A0A6M0SZM0_CLOBO|nr:MinD/ParA family protein [Clostridium sporogenes]NFA60022.1 MinD/ParA family protein [Clostridium botulinum]NFI73658.1 MinD/ParA family protein [Clostridium sporogenes]NFL72955.1 MinD/ParA family protein [Clostridium sporogenes]NFM23838.1 MinD/ParA family protein [Clostridium sporogenes]NFP61532.1 MinD/ParA family protein [Clostridium sporogenes]
MLDQAEKLRQLVNDKDKSVNPPKIITVTSGKGGVGKSNFVVNLAITLQKMGKKVLILDADIGMGNDDVLMGVMPKYSIYDIIFNNKTIEQVLIKGPFGVKLLPAGTAITNLEGITEEQIERFIKNLSTLEELDYIIMDTGAGVNRSVLGFISCSEELIILTTPEPTAITDAYSLLKAVSHFNIKQNAKLVINKTIDDQDGKITYNKFKNAVNKFLHIDLEYLGCIQEDRKAIQAVRRQIPFVIVYPNCNASKDIISIAKNILGNSKIYNDNVSVERFFKKLFSIFS